MITGRGGYSWSSFVVVYGIELIKQYIKIQHAVTSIVPCDGVVIRDGIVVKTDEPKIRTCPPFA
ncbi:MAG TPA: hypothetical protein O0X23_02710 [Methanocorpusculum sp.]|nr:hypothetical protein [Methanocorpusculum sp.]